MITSSYCVRAFASTKNPGALLRDGSAWFLDDQPPARVARPAQFNRFYDTTYACSQKPKPMRHADIVAAHREHLYFQ